MFVYDISNRGFCILFFHKVILLRFQFKYPQLQYKQILKLNIPKIQRLISQVLGDKIKDKVSALPKNFTSWNNWSGMNFSPNKNNPLTVN